MFKCLNELQTGTTAVNMKNVLNKLPESSVDI